MHTMLEFTLGLEEFLFLVTFPNLFDNELLAKNSKIKRIALITGSSKITDLFVNTLNVLKKLLLKLC